MSKSSEYKKGYHQGVMDCIEGITNNSNEEYAELIIQNTNEQEEESD